MVENYGQWCSSEAIIYFSWLRRTLSALILKGVSIFVPFNDWILSLMWSSSEGRRKTLRTGKTRLWRSLRWNSTSCRGPRQWRICLLRLGLSWRQGYHQSLTLRIMFELRCRIFPFVACNNKMQWLYLVNNWRLRINEKVKVRIV